MNFKRFQWFIASSAWIFLVLCHSNLWAREGSPESELNQACILDGEMAVSHVLSLMQRSRFHGAYAEYHRKQGTTQFVVAEYRLSQGETTALSPLEMARQKALFIDQQIKTQIAELSAGYYSQFDPDVSAGLSQTAPHFSQEELEIESLTPITTLYMASLLLKKLREEGFSRIAEMELLYETRQAELAPAPGIPSSIPKRLRSRVCLLATHVFLESLELTPLAVVRDAFELELVMKELEELNPTYKSVTAHVQPELESRWKAVPKFALDSYRRKFDWYRFLQGTAERGEVPRYVKNEAQTTVFRRLVDEELQSLRQLLGFNEANIGTAAVQGLAKTLEPSGIEKDQRVLDLWHARMEREIARQTFAGHKSINNDLWEPFLSKAIQDYPHILPCEIRKDCDENKSIEPVFEKKGRGLKLGFEKEFYESVYRVLAAVEHPYVMPVMAKLAELNLEQIPDWAMKLLSGDIHQPLGGPGTEITLKENEKKLDDYFYPQRAALYLLAFNLRWFPNAHLEMLQQWSVGQMYALETRCDQERSLCNADHPMGTLVSDFLDKYAELHALASSISQMRQDHERSYFQNSFDPSFINDGSIYPLPDLNREIELEPTKWGDELNDQETSTAGWTNQPSDKSQRVNNVGYHLDQLSKNLTLRDLIHTPHRVVWHVSDHPEQIPIMVAALFVLGGISIFWSPFIFVIDTLFVVSVATHLVIHAAHLSGASKAENRDDSGKYRGLRAAQSRMAISNQVMWVVPFVRPLTKRYVSLFQSARKSYGQMRDFRKACEILELPYAKPHRITMRTVKNALKEFQIKLHPDRFVRTPELQTQNLRRLEEMLKAADYLGGLFKSRGAILNARIPTTNSEVLRAYEVLRMKPGTSLAKVHRRLDLRGTRIEALRRAGKAMKHQQSKFEAKAQELEVSLSKGRAAAEVLAHEASKLDVALTASDLKGRMLGILIQRFIRSKSGKPWKPDMDIVEENPLLLPEYSQAQLNFPVPSFGEMLARAKGAA